MKSNSVLLALMTATLLAACAPKEEAKTTTETTTTTTTEPATTDTATTETTTTETTTTETTDAATTEDSTMANGDDATAGEEMDMAAGDGLEGKVMDWDGTGKTFGLNEDDKNYKVTVTDTTEYVGVDGATMTADDFFAADQTDKKVAVEGEINGTDLAATKITMQADDGVSTDVDADPASDAPDNE